MSKYFLEHANTYKVAHDRWFEVVAKHGLTCIEKDYSVNGTTSRLCYLQTPQNLTVRGAGKGRNLEQIELSARYEAIEYFFSGSRYFSSTILWQDLTEITKKYNLLLYRCEEDIFFAEAQKASQIPWVLYEDIRSQERYVVPLAAVDLSYRSFNAEKDTFNYDKCNLYATSNGLASSSTYEASLIHAILEVLERDAYSYFLIDCYVLKKPLFILNKKTLPLDLQAFISIIEKNFRNKIILMKMPSRYGVEAFIATFEKKIFSIQPRGSGASLIAQHAIERAITELLQSYNLMYGNFEFSKAPLNSNTLIKNFLALDLKEFLKMKHHLLDFNDNSSSFITLTLQNYLNKLLELIYAQNSSLLVNVPYKDTNGLTCLRAIIPDAEEFFLTTPHCLKLKPKNITASYIKDQIGIEFSWDNIKRN